MKQKSNYMYILKINYIILSLYSFVICKFFSTPVEAAGELPNKTNSSITDRLNEVNSTASSASSGNSLEAIKHLLFDEGMLFTMFSAIALLIALLGAAIIIGKKR